MTMLSASVLTGAATMTFFTPLSKYGDRASTVLNLPVHSRTRSTPRAFQSNWPGNSADASGIAPTASGRTLVRQLVEGGDDLVDAVERPLGLLAADVRDGPPRADRPYLLPSQRARVRMAWPDDAPLAPSGWR